MGWGRELFSASVLCHAEPVIESTRRTGDPPLVVAHRGASSVEPEHSMAAYLRAISDGADAVECDVRLTADGNLVLVHDRRIDRTSDGSGYVSALHLDELLQRDFSGGASRWMDFEDPKGHEYRARVLTLDRFLSDLTAVSSTVQFSIETKHPTRYRGYVERELAATLRKFGLGEPARDSEVQGTASQLAMRVRVMSFSYFAVRRMPKLLPEVPSVYLVDRLWPWVKSGSLPKGTSVLGPSIEVLRSHPEIVRRVHENGHEVHVWTVDENDDVDLCLELGVDAIITNRPGAVKARITAR